MKAILLFIFLLNVLYVSGSDSVRMSRRSAALLWGLPAAGVTYGVLSRFNELPFRRLDRWIGAGVSAHVPRRYRVDDYIQFAPALWTLGLDFFPGVSSRHNFRDRVLIMGMSYMITGVVVQTMKGSISVRRPSGVDYRSFPSGHTAVAFTGIHLFYREYVDLPPWLSISGYTLATLTGVLRSLNSAHWLSDVLTGASLGILSAECGYRLLPFCHRVLGIGSMDGGIVLMPLISSESLGIGCVWSLP